MGRNCREKKIENSSKNTDSSMSNFAKSVKKSVLYNTFSCARLREILKNEKQKKWFVPLTFVVGFLREGN